MGPNEPFRKLPAGPRDPVKLRPAWLLKNKEKKKKTKLYQSLIICKINVILETNLGIYEKKKTLQGFPSLLFVSL